MSAENIEAKVSETFEKIEETANTILETTTPTEDTPVEEVVPTVEEVVPTVEEVVPTVEEVVPTVEEVVPTVEEVVPKVEEVVPKVEEVVPKVEEVVPTVEEIPTVEEEEEEVVRVREFKKILIDDYKCTTDDNINFTFEFEKDEKSIKTIFNMEKLVAVSYVVGEEEEKKEIDFQQVICGGIGEFERSQALKIMIRKIAFVLVDESLVNHTVEFPDEEVVPNEQTPYSKICDCLKIANFYRHLSCGRFFNNGISPEAIEKFYPEFKACAETPTANDVELLALLEVYCN